LLFVARRAITRKEQPTALSNALRFVYGEYEVAFFWWEVLEMIRRFLLVGLMSIVYEGSVVQLVIATLFSILYLVIQLQAKPFVDPSDDYIALASSASLAVLFFSCVVLKVGVLTDTPEVDAILPPRLRENFGVPSALLTVVIFASVVCSLLIALLFSILRVWAERKRKQLDAQTTKAKRLRNRKTKVEVKLEPVAEGHFHLFLSHTWSQGEEAMRTVKMMLGEMLPTAKVFLDKDDLKDGAGAEYVLKSNVVLIYCTERYFQSRACAREIVYAVLLKKPLAAVLEPDPARGGLTRRAIVELLTKQRFTPHDQKGALADHSWVAKWKLEDEVAKWGFKKMPTGAEIEAALFQERVIEWNRLTAFQGVSVRMVAARVVSEKERIDVCVEGEAGTQAIAPPPLTHGRKFHLYCSPHNAGAETIGIELTELLERLSLGSSRRGASGPLLKTTLSLEDVDKCEHMLVYLTTKTWTNGKHSTELAREIGKARRKGVHLLLVHELPSLILDDDVGTDRGACDFYDLWNEGWTPKHLLASSLYNQIALPLKPGEFHKAALAVVLGKLSEGGGERVKLSEEDIRLSEQAEEKGLREHAPAKLQPKAEHEPADRRSNNRMTKAGGTPPEEQRGKSSAARPKSSYRAAAATGGRPKSSYRAAAAATTFEQQPSGRASMAPHHMAASSSAVAGSTTASAGAADAARAVTTLRASCSGHDARRSSIGPCRATFGDSSAEGSDLALPDTVQSLAYASPSSGGGSPSPQGSPPRLSVSPSPDERPPSLRPIKAVLHGAASSASRHSSSAGPADAACAALRRSVTAHDARRSSMRLSSDDSRCSEASPPNAAHASLPSATSLPRPPDEIRRTQRSSVVRSKPATSTQPNYSAREPTAGSPAGSRPPQSPGTPAYLEREDDDETAVDKEFGHVEEPPRVPVRASRTTRRSTNGVLGGGGGGRVAI
jgi:hypothetical protein